MLLENTFPYLPTSSLTETLVYVVAGVGVIMLIYSIFLDVERRQDLVMLIGASCLLVYALFINNWFFIIAMAGIALASVFEFVEIYLGLHKHDPAKWAEVKKLK